MFIYNNPFLSYVGNDVDTVHTIGCTNPGYKVRDGCKAPVI